MRLFFALPLPDEALDALEAAGRAFAAAASTAERAGAEGAAGVFGRARWSPRANLHLTLAFLGECDDAGLAAALAAGDEAFGRRPTIRGAHVAAAEPAEAGSSGGLALRLEGWGAFPRVGAAAVLWAGLARSPELLATGAHLRAALDRAGLSYDRSPFKPHLTLARFSKPASLRGLPPGAVPDLEFRAREAALYRSVLGGGPPRYELLGSWGL